MLTERPRQPSPSPLPPRSILFTHEPNPFESFLALPEDYNLQIQETADKYEKYIKLSPQGELENPILWWRDNEFRFPNLAQMAFDLFAIPAISSECERVFSQTKLLITDKRNRLSDLTIEATECLKHWLQVGVITL